MKKTQVGLIGTGWITPYHLKGYKALEDRVEIKAVADINRQKAKVIADELKVKFIFSDYKKLLKMEEINAVDISLPTHLHAEAVVAAAEEGKHILCEKPFATNVKECNEMLEAAKRNKVWSFPSLSINPKKLAC
jgi:predicted dehydrogenase